MALKESQGSYWGLTRQIGPYKPTSIDKARAHSQHNGAHAGHADHQLSMNPHPYIQTRPPSKPFEYLETSVVLNLDYKPSSKTLGKHNVVRGPAGAARGGDRNLQVINRITNNYTGGPGGDGPGGAGGGGGNGSGGGGYSGGNQDIEPNTDDIDSGSNYYDANDDGFDDNQGGLDNIKRKGSYYVIPRIVPRAEPVKDEEVEVPEYYQNNYTPIQYPSLPSEMDPADRDALMGGDESAQVKEETKAVVKKSKGGGVSKKLPGAPTSKAKTKTAAATRTINPHPAPPPVSGPKTTIKKSKGGVSKKTDYKISKAKNFKTKSVLGKRPGPGGTTGGVSKKTRTGAHKSDSTTKSALGKHGAVRPTHGRHKKTKLTPQKGPKGVVTTPPSTSAAPRGTRAIEGPRRLAITAPPAAAPRRRARPAPINTNVPKVKGPAAGKRGQGKSMDKHIPIKRPIRYVHPRPT